MVSWGGPNLVFLLATQLCEAEFNELKKKFDVSNGYLALFTTNKHDSH